MSEKLSKLLIPISIIVTGVIVAGVFVYLNQEKIKGSPEEKPTAEQVANKAIEYINNNKNNIAGGQTASLLDVVDEGEIYKIRLKVGEGEYDSYVTKDGKLLFPTGYKLEEVQGETSPPDDTTVENSKTERPDVKLFVMSYCPYGLQAQKMFLPVYNLLKDRADMGVYFVDYIMHGKKEIDENLNQYCVQKEEKEKYYNYLNCFVLSGNSEDCLAKAKIDRTKLASCVAETDQAYNIYNLYNDKNTWLSGRYPKFPVYEDLNEKYGVQGSPTIVINDQAVNVSPRSPEKFKETVCQTFNSPPEECSQILSSEAPSSGIGGGTGPSASGGCGQ